MIELILIIILIIGLFKPEILLSKKMKEKANEEQKKVLTKNLRKIFAIVIVPISIDPIEKLGDMMYTNFLGLILAIVFFVLVFAVALPAIQENNRIVKEIKKEE